MRLVDYSLLHIYQRNFWKSRIKPVMIIIIILITLGSCSSSKETQEIIEEPWGITVGGIGWDYGLGVAVDQNDGSVYMAGVVEGDMEPDQMERFQLSKSDVCFLSKFTPSGELIWTREWELGSIYYIRVVMNITVDNMGDILVLGQFEEQLILPNENQMISLSPDEFLEIYLLKFSSSGEFLWHEKWDGTYGGFHDIWWDPNYTLTADNDGNIYTTGRSNEIRKFNMDGEYEWGHEVYMSITDAECDKSGNYYFTGTYYVNKPLLFNKPDSIAGLNILPLISENAEYQNSLSDQGVGILVKMDTSGTVSWVRIIDSGYSLFTHLTIDEVGNTYIFGSTLQGVIIYDDLDQIETDFESEHRRGKYILSFDTSGTVRWFRQLLDSFSLWTGDFQVNECGNLYIAGKSNGTGIFVDGVESSNVTQIGWLILKFDTEGNFEKLKEFNNHEATLGGLFWSDIDIVTYGCNTIYATGGFKGNLGLDEVPINGHTESISDGYDLYLVKLIE